MSDRGLTSWRALARLSSYERPAEALLLCTSAYEPGEKCIGHKKCLPDRNVGCMTRFSAFYRRINNRYMRALNVGNRICIPKKRVRKYRSGLAAKSGVKSVVRYYHRNLRLIIKSEIAKNGEIFSFSHENRRGG